MDAKRVVAEWDDAHVTVEPPSPAAIAAVNRALALVPEPEALAAITRTDGRPLIAALAGRTLYLLWAVQDSARLRRIPLDPAATAVELSERRDVRHWSFEIDEEPLVFRTTGDDAPERFARALAGALGWPQ
jgi:hypothetical protein